MPPLLPFEGVEKRDPGNEVDKPNEGVRFHATPGCTGVHAQCLILGKIYFRQLYRRIFADVIVYIFAH